MSGSPKSHEHRELDCIDGESAVFEWKDFPRHTTMQLPRDIQTTMEEHRSQPEQSEDRVIFMSMYNDIDSGKAGHNETCISNYSEVAACARRFPKGHWSFLGPGTEKRGMERTHTSQTVCEQFCGDDDGSSQRKRTHPMFRGTSALARGLLKSKRGGKTSVHHNGD